MIELERIWFTREGRNILTDVNLHMKSGEHWVILGKNGSGKSTILEMINGYHFPTSGRITVLEQIYGQCDVREVRKQIGYISQNLFEKMSLRDPVWEVVATGEYAFLRFYQEIPGDVRAKALDKLELVRLPHLQHQPLGTLSQGERKKVMLARALMTDPRVLILDEPCSGLDLYEREMFLSTLHHLRRPDMTMVYVTHHIEEIMPIFTHVALLEQGQIVAQGSKRQVLTAELLREAYQVPVSVEWANDRPWVKVV